MYCTGSDVRPALDQDKAKYLLGITHDGDITDDELAPHIQSAEDEINSNLGSWYVIPVTGAQSLVILKGIAVGLTLSYIYLTNEDEDLPVKIRQRITRATQTLKSYAAGANMSTRDDIVVRPMQFLPDAPSNQTVTTSTANKALNYARGL